MQDNFASTFNHTKSDDFSYNLNRFSCLSLSNFSKKSTDEGNVSWQDTFDDDDSEYENIFKTMSTPVTDPGLYLNFRILDELYPDSCYYCEVKDNKLSKIFLDKSLFDWDLYIYTKLLPFRIIPNLEIKENELVYDLTNLISLRQFIKQEYVSSHLIINELLAFVLSFQLVNFIHGYLTIDTVFVNNIDSNKIKFYVVDFSFSLLKKSPITSFKKYIDIYTLYNSIIDILRDKDMINYLNAEINSYIPPDEFDKLDNIKKIGLTIQSQNYLDIIDCYSNS
jgi:hypothetical protein